MERAVDILGGLGVPLPSGLGDRYRPVRLLGAGGFGRVLLCEDLHLERQVALKLLTAPLSDEDAVGRFRREARVTAELRHPRVVTVYDFGVADGGLPFIAYAHLPGPDLGTAAADRGRPAPAITTWACQLAEALAVAHEAGLVHRDVKPENVLLDADGHAVLTDFGLVRAQDSSRVTFLTAEDLVLGTPAVMAPELFLGTPASPASDQFAWGATVFHLLTGAFPYGATDLKGVLRALQGGWHQRLGEPLRDVEAGLARAVQRALEPDPRRRFESMEATRRALAPSGTPWPEPRGETPASGSLPAGALAAGGSAQRFPGRVSAGTLALIGACALLGWLGPSGAPPPAPPSAAASEVGPAPPEVDRAAAIPARLLALGVAARAAWSQDPPGVTADTLLASVPPEDIDKIRVVMDPAVQAAFRSLVEALALSLRGPDGVAWRAASRGGEHLATLGTWLQDVRPPVPGSGAAIMAAIRDDRTDSPAVQRRAQEDWRSLVLVADDALVAPVLAAGNPAPRPVLVPAVSLAVVCRSGELRPLVQAAFEGLGARAPDPAEVQTLDRLITGLGDSDFRAEYACHDLIPLVALAAEPLLGRAGRSLDPGGLRNRSIFLLSAALENSEHCGSSPQPGRETLLEVMERLLVVVRAVAGPLTEGARNRRAEMLRALDEGGRPDDVRGRALADQLRQVLVSLGP